MLGFIRAGYTFVGAWDICPAATKVLKRRYWVPCIDIMTEDINKPFPRHRLPIDKCDVVTVALQCQCSSTNNYKRSENDSRFDTGERMLLCAIILRPLVIVVENVRNFKKMRRRFKRALDLLADSGYRVEHFELNSVKWHPSSRPRIFIVASRVSAGPMCADFAAEVAAMRPLTIGDFFHATSIWHPVRPGGHGHDKPTRQHCVIPSWEHYPLVDTKCLKKPPASYNWHPKDHEDGIKGTTYPTVQTLCIMLGFPTDYFTQEEINAPQCTCPACKGHRQPQIAQQLGKSWSPCAAFNIAKTILPHLGNCEEIRERFLDFDPADAMPGHVLNHLDHFREATLSTYRSRIGVAAGEAVAAWTAAHVSSQVYLSEQVCKDYVTKVEKETGQDISRLAPPEVYSLDQVKIGPNASSAAKAEAIAMIKEFSDVFAKNSNELPKPVLDDNGQEVVIHFKFREDYTPFKAPRPNARGGSATVKILTCFRRDYESKDLIVADYACAWANRPHLVAKYAEDAHRVGTPDSIRFTGDLTGTNKQIELIPATHGNVQEELDRTAGHRWYISADAMSAYWSFKLSRESSEACAVWLPDDHGNWVKYRFLRMQMGAKNSACHMQRYYFHICTNSDLRRDNYANLADDFQMFDDTEAGALKEFRSFLVMCRKRQVTLKPAKVKVLFNHVDFYGWRLDINGISPSERNISPFRKMIEPNDMSDLRHVCGLFNCFTKFIVIYKPDAATGKTRPHFYKELIEPMSVATMSKKTEGCSFTSAWGEEQRAAFNAIRDLLLTGVHLFTPLPDRALHMSTDMSLFGWGCYLYQIGDDGERRTIAMCNGKWTFSEISMPAVYKEGSAWCRGFEWALPMAKCHGHPFYTKTDSLPVSWIRKGNGRKAMSQFRLAQFDDIEWHVGYLDGPRNVEADAVSRPPMLGPLDPSIVGLSQMVTRALALLPGTHAERTKTYRNVWVWADRDTSSVAEIVRKWRGKQGRILKDGLAKICPSFRPPGKPIKSTPFDLAVALPPVEYGPQVCCDLLGSGKPFICMVVTELLMECYRNMDGTWNAERKAQLERTSRLIYSAAGFTFVIGGFQHSPKHTQVFLTNASSTGDAQDPAARSDALPAARAPRTHRLRPNALPHRTLGWYHAAQHPVCDADTYEQHELDAECMHHFFTRCFLGAGDFNATLPGLGGVMDKPVGDISSWIEEQKDEVAAVAKADRDRLQPRTSDGALLFCDNDEFGRVFVPKSKRTNLVTLAHERMLHLGHRIIHSHLARWYWWPHMFRDIKEQLKSCTFCQLAKQKRRLSHKQFRSSPLSVPRTQWGFDLKGVHAAANGHNEIGVAIDLSSHRLVLFSCEGRDADVLIPHIRNRIVYTYGVPLRWRTDHAQELVGRAMTKMWSMYGVKASTTASYHPQGNAAAESAMRFINICLTLLSDKQYKRWPEYLMAFECAWNSHVVSSIGCTPFEACHGRPMLTPCAALAMAGADLEADAVDPLDVVNATRASAKAYAEYAAANEAYAQHKRLQRLNASGNTRTFEIGDSVCVYVPPSASEATRRARTVKHMAWFRGPCKVVATDGTTFTVEHSETGKVFKRTLQNIAPWNHGKSWKSKYLTSEKRTTAPVYSPKKSPTRAAMPSSTDGIAVGDVLAAKDEPSTDKYWIVVVSAVTDDDVTVRLYATNSPTLKIAKFMPCFSHDKNNTWTVSKAAAKQKIFSPWTMTLVTNALPVLVVAHGLGFKSGNSGVLTKDSIATLSKFTGKHRTLTHYTTQDDVS